MLEENAISTGVIVLKKAYPTVKIYHDEFDENADWMSENEISLVIYYFAIYIYQ